MRRAKLHIIVLFFAFLIFNFFGCATAPTTVRLPTYSINGVDYVSLPDLCASRNIALDYDTFTRTAALRKDAHKINLMVGDTLILVDGESTHIGNPVRMYQGTVVVPYKFKEQIIDELFKEFRPSQRATIPLQGIKRIVVAAGHGGDDPGAIGRTGIREKDVVLDVARRVANLLKEEGAEVVMTRSSDRFIPLESRAEIANSYKADLFLSIHANANRVRSLNGFEVYYVANSVDDSRRALWAAQHARLNFSSNCFASNSLTLKAIIWDMIYTSSRAQSIELARSICRRVDRNMDTRVLGIKGGRFYVLKGTRMPAILVEIGFLSNANEERLLRNNSYRQSIAEAIVAGLTDYAQESVLAQGA